MGCGLRYGALGETKEAHISYLIAHSLQPTAHSRNENTTKFDKHMKIIRLTLFFLAFTALLFILIHPASSQEKFDFSKKGKIHDEVIYSWDTYYRDYFAGEIKKRLFDQGDVYILYDAQIQGLQSFVEMTRRCKDTKQMAELVDMLSPVFSQLKPIAPDNSKGWICTGGPNCTAYNLLGKEVPLCSVQFLGLMGALATNITENIPQRKQTQAEKAFVANTFNTIAVQLDRWFTPGYFKSLDNRLPRTAADMKNANPGALFLRQGSMVFNCSFRYLSTAPGRPSARRRGWKKGFCPSANSERGYWKNIRSLRGQELYHKIC